MFVVLTLLYQLLREIAPRSGWRERLFQLFDRFPDVPLKPMGKSLAFLISRDRAFANQMGYSERSKDQMSARRRHRVGVRRLTTSI